MVYDELYFGGDVVPAVVEKFPVIRKAQRKFTSYNIPGRNGDIIVQQDAYNNVILPYQIWCGEKGEVQTDWTDLAAVLYKNGYQKLSDIADPEHYRKAVFNGPIDAQYYWDQVGRTTIEFNCRPERFLVDGATETHYTAAANDSYYTLNASQIYYEVRDYFKEHGFDSEILYAFDVPTSAATKVIVAQGVAGTTPIPFAILNTGGDPTINTGWVMNGQMSDGVSTKGTTNLRWYDGWNQSYTVVMPSGAFNGIPYVVYFHLTPLDPRTIGGPVELNNPYMPCHPTIILECKTAHIGEFCAAIIDQYGIYIKDGDLTTPFYFIDTENMTLTKAASKTGERFFADNIRVDAGIQLKTGVNQIFTSSLYAMDITPHFWEL